MIRRCDARDWDRLADEARDDRAWIEEMERAEERAEDLAEERAERARAAAAKLGPPQLIDFQVGGRVEKRWMRPVLNEVGGWDRWVPAEGHGGASK